MNSTRGANRPPEEQTTRERLQLLLADVRWRSRHHALGDGRTEDEDIDTAALELQLDAPAKTHELHVRYQASPLDCTYNATFDVFIVLRPCRRVRCDGERQTVGSLGCDLYDPLDGPGDVMVGPARWELLHRSRPRRTSVD